MKKTIVIADIDEKFCKELEAELTKRGTYELVGIANDGETAFQLAKEQRPDIFCVGFTITAVRWNQYSG